jgi:guanine deaminase
MVGLGTDVAGGYSLDIMDAMRQAITTSRMREGAKMIARAEGGLQEANSGESLSVDWREALYLATRGGALALGLPRGCGLFEVGAPFDVQCSLWCSTLWSYHNTEKRTVLQFEFSTPKRI